MRADPRKTGRIRGVLGVLGIVMLILKMKKFELYSITVSVECGAATFAGAATPHRFQTA